MFVSFRMSLQLSAAKLQKIFEIHKIFNKKCKRIRILCCKALLFAKKICTFDADFLFLLSRSPQKHRSERDDFLFRYRRDFVILHVLGYYQHQCSNVRFNLLRMGHLFVFFVFEWQFCFAFFFYRTDVVGSAFG